MNLFDRFFQDRDSLYNSFNSFDNKHNLRLLNKLSQENNEVQFLSLVTEINFGIFFDKLGCSLIYENPYGVLTPDWTVEKNGQKIILEVLRLNPSAKDKRKLDFDDNFIDAIQEIKIGCFLDFDYVENEIDRDKIDIQKSKLMIESWLRQHPKENDTIILFKVIKIQLLKFTNSVEHACLNGGGGAINFDFRRLSADNSPLIKKAKKYSELIKNNDLPYIICIYMDFHTWFTKDDLYQRLYKGSKYSMENALYDSPTNVMEDVSGILLRQNDEHTYFHNFSNDNRLNDLNKEMFKDWQYPHG